MQEGQIIKRDKSWGLRYREKDAQGKWQRKYKTICQIDGRYRTEHQVRQHPEYLKFFERSEAGTSELTLHRYIEETYLPYTQANKSPSTFKGYKNIFRGTVAPLVNDLPLADFGSPNVSQSLLNKIASSGRKKDGSPLSTQSLINAKSFLSGVISHAIRNGHMPKNVIFNPMHHKLVVVEGGAATKDTYAHSLAEVEKILVMLKDEPLYRTLAAVAAYTGLRRGEIRGLQWKDVEFNAKTKWGKITVERSFWEGVEKKPKTLSSAAEIPLIPQLTRELEAYRKTLPLVSQDSFLFEGRHPNVPFDISALGNKHIKPIIGPLWHGWHSFRRQLGDSLLELGVPMSTVADILRHKQPVTVNIVTERHYTKASWKLMNEAMQRFSKQVEKVRAVSR